LLDHRRTRFQAQTPLYGSGDNYDLNTSHVLPALIRKFHEAKERGDPTVPVWGTSSPRREFLCVDDMADALVFLMDNFDADPKNPDDVFVNVGVGEDLSIKELAELIGDVVGYDGKISWDSSMPDGTPQKLLDVSRMAKMGWKAKTSLKAGVHAAYNWYMRN
jgi:GDP-L-fucose synthase